MNSFKFALLLSKGNKTEFDVRVEDQKAFLNGIKDPDDDFERSYFQYKCQGFFIPKWKTILLNIVALLLYIPACAWLFAKRLWIVKLNSIIAIGEFKGIEETLPLEVTDEYEVNNDVWDGNKSLGISDLGVLLRLIAKYPFQPYFTLKCILKIAMYSNMVKRHSPKAIIVHNEYSFTSSILTYYCSIKKVLHINAMHGDKYFFIRDSFFHYDKCYVWDDYYVDLFLSLKAEGRQFVIAIPPSLKIDIDKYQNKDCYADYKYYLDGYNEEEIRRLSGYLTLLYKDGCIIKYRPHPRYSDVGLLRKYVPAECIEDPYAVNILSSIANTKIIIGMCSTVMLQAYMSGKSIILDDISNPSNYTHLQDLGYILSKKEIPKLSSFINHI